MKKRLIILSIISTIGLCLTLFVFNGLHQNNKLFEAVKNNDYAAAEKAIKKGAWINARDDIYAGCLHIHWNPTPLMESCAQGNYDIVKLLVENGAKVNKKDNVMDYTPLLATFMRVNENRYKIAQYLVDNVADIYYSQNKYHTVLSKAVEVYERDSEQVKNESLEFVKYLIEQNVDTYVKWGAERNVFTLAAGWGNILVFEYLLENKIFDINFIDEFGNTALIAAAKGNNIEIVQYLLTNNADINIKDKDSKTAYDYAVENNLTDVAEVLKQHSYS